MTREERINSALLPILEKMREHRATDEMCKMYDNGFHVGAMWADAHPNWISVEDKKPKLKYENDGFQYSEAVIVTDGKYRISANWVHNIWAGWYCWLIGGDEELEGITHWIPLPQPPKKGGEE